MTISRAAALNRGVANPGRRWFTSFKLQVRRWLSRPRPEPFPSTPSSFLVSTRAGVHHSLEALPALCPPQGAAGPGGLGGPGFQRRRADRDGSTPRGRDTTSLRSLPCFLYHGLPHDSISAGTRARGSPPGPGFTGCLSTLCLHGAPGTGNGPVQGENQGHPGTLLTTAPWGGRGG